MKQATERDQMRKLYLEMVDLNGTYRNQALRRLSDETLASLREYAQSQPGIGGHGDPIAFDVRVEQRKRAV